MSRPEGTKPPDLFYDETEARKYDSSSRMINIQREISNRAIEMLGLPTDRPSYILDIGCGSGLSGLALEEAGHYWVGCDISASMLDVANQRENEKGDLMKHDMGQGLPFRPGTFDGVISISALQWLCYSDSNDQNPIHRYTLNKVTPFGQTFYSFFPPNRLNKFFSSLYMVLKKDARAVLQFYPETSEQAVVIAQAASKVGFAGGVVIDYPNSSKAKKYYLCLSFERAFKVPGALGTGGEIVPRGVEVVGRDRGQASRSNKPHRAPIKSKDWIVKKKEQRLKQGKEVKSDSKFTGRKRHAGF